MDGVQGTARLLGETDRWAPVQGAESGRLSGLGREPFLMEKSQGLVRGPHFESDPNEIGKRGQDYSPTNVFILFFMN